MSALLLPHPLPDARASTVPGGSWWTRLAHAIVSEYRARRAMRALNGLSDERLGDIGLGRGGIEHAVRSGRG